MSSGRLGEKVADEELDFILSEKPTD